jgi:hypothetical protein
MGWVVKSLRTDVLDALRQDAERDARRIRRGAGRVAGDVAEQLDALEALGLELRATVQSRRARGARPPDPALAELERALVGPQRSLAAPKRSPAAPERPPAEPRHPEPDPPRPRPGRASLHRSPLTELLRATDGRPRAGGPVA